MKMLKAKRYPYLIHKEDIAKKIIDKLSDYILMKDKLKSNG